MIFIFSFSLKVKCQKEANIWYFGEYAGIDFNSGSPVALTNSAMSQYEGCATISDANGNLLFYTNGMTVWNRNHDVMENGTDLMGHPSSTQSGVIVPFPDDTSKYYIFTVDAEISTEKGLRYSIVDLTLDNGNGAVTNEKNIFLNSPTEEKVTAVRHGNGKDIWVITHLWNSDKFLSYLITKDGLDTNPVVSHIGTYHQGSDVHGSMKVSPNGKKLAIIVRQIKSFELFDFDDQTGEVSNPISFPPFTGNGTLYGIGYSPDCSKLYVSRYLDGSDIFQYNLDAGSPDEIISSKTWIGSVSNYHLGALQLAPDKKIYVSKHDNLVGDNYLGVINNPNAQGLSCNFVEDGFYLAGKKCIWGLPNFIQSYFEIAFTWKPDCYGDTTQFTPTNTDVDSVLWDFGDPVSGNSNISHELYPWHIFTSSGLFNVSLTGWLNGKSHTVIREVFIKDNFPVSLGSDTAVCSGTNILLNAGSGYDSYLWQNGSTDSTYLVDTSGIYWVAVENECGTTSDTISVNFGEAFDIDLGVDTAFCYGHSLILNPGGGFINYLWQDGSNDSINIAGSTGIYWVQVTDSVGCTAVDSVSIQTYMDFDFSIGNDTTICAGDYIFLNAPAGYQSYLWQDGSNYNSFIADTSGIYWLEITDSVDCAARDSLLLITDKVHDNFLGDDTLFCKDSTITLRTNPSFEQYLWQDGTSGSVYTTTDIGKYWVDVVDTLGCVGSDTININYYPDLTLELSSIGSLCDDDSVLLTAESNFQNYLWQDSSTNSYYLARDSGTYWVRVSNPCETKSDTIVIDACSSIWIPNVFTPNNDGYNDYFHAVGKNIPKFKMEIFNRWGQVLKVLNSIDEKWDGTYHGQQVAEGTYFYVVDYEQVNRDGSTEHKRLQGSVTLIR